MNANNPLAKVEELEVGFLLEGLYQVYGADFRGYERSALLSKLRAFLHARQLGTLSALQDGVLHDEGLATALIRAIGAGADTPPDSPERLRALRDAVVPLLRSCPWPRIWVAECTRPETVMALAILLEQEGLYSKTQLFVTHASDACLTQASPLRLSVDHMKAIERSHRDRGGLTSLQDYCTSFSDGFELSPELQRNIFWAQHDLVSDASFNEFQLIVCQRRLSEFGLPLQRRAMRLFTQSLCMFGVLQVEPLADLSSSGFAANYAVIAADHGIHRRVS